MDIKELLTQLNSELKKDPLEKNVIINHINHLVSAYNGMMDSLKIKPGVSSDTEALKKEIEQSEKKYKKKVIDLYTIFEIAKDLSASLNIDNLINTIILTSLGHLLVENGSIFVLNEKMKKYTFKKAKGIKTGIEDIEFDSEEEIIQYIKANPRPFPQKDFINSGGNARYQTLFQNLNCDFIIPFIIKNKMNGILFLGPKSGQVPFTDSNIEFLTALSNFAAIALDNAKLYTDLDHKVRDLSALYNISREINKSTETGIVLDLMMETITTGFGVKKCAVILFHDLKNSFTIERNFNIEAPESEKYLRLILDKKLENALEKNESVFLQDKELLGSDIFFSIPLVAGNKKVGLLNIYRFEEGIVLDEDLKQIFAIIASQMAPPIVLTFYLSRSETYRENPYDYIFNHINTLIDKAKESGISFVLCRLLIMDEDLDFKTIKTMMERIRPILQPTDSLLHSGFNELLLIFSVTTKEEVENLIHDFIKNIAQIKKISYKITAYPEDGEDVDHLLKTLYGA